MKTLSKQRVFHVGTLTQPPAGKKKLSYEGTGLSVSEHPEEWRRITSLHGRTRALARLDERSGRFADITSLTPEHIELAHRLGLLQDGAFWRVAQFDDEWDQTFLTDFETKAEAEENFEDDLEEGDATLEEIRGPVASPQLEQRWAGDFGDPLPLSMVLDAAVLYALEDEYPELDGAWWNEQLDVARLSAPRGVVFRSRLDQWGPVAR